MQQQRSRLVGARGLDAPAQIECQRTQIPALGRRGRNLPKVNLGIHSSTPRLNATL
jgi:hypothetical protein